MNEMNRYGQPSAYVPLGRVTNTNRERNSLDNAQVRLDWAKRRFAELEALKGYNNKEAQHLRTQFASTYHAIPSFLTFTHAFNMALPYRHRHSD